MLDLVGRLAGFGISVMMATHLLDDVQRVCEHVVMIDAGHLVLAGPIDQLVQRTGVMRVEVGGRADAVGALAQALAARGCPPRGRRPHPRRRHAASWARTPSTSCATPWPTSACGCTRCRPATGRSTTCSSRRRSR